MIRKEYIAPAVEVYEVEAEHMIATSPEVDYRPDEDIETEWTNKRQPASSPWDSSNWSTKE
jgi:hypothetical protein